MQGRRSSIASFPETLDVDHGSAPSNAVVDQQIRWNSLRNSPEDQMPDYIVPPSDANFTYVNSCFHEGHNLSPWNIGGASSSNTQHEMNYDVPKSEHEWPPALIDSAPGGPSLEGGIREPANFLSNFGSSQNLSGRPSSDTISHNIDSNAGLSVYGDGCEMIQHPISQKSGISINERIPSTSTSVEPFGTHSRSVRHLTQENDGRIDCSLQGRRLSCKRKALEGNMGQSSIDGSSAECSVSHAMSVRHNVGSNLSISTPSETLLSVPEEVMIARPDIGTGEASYDNIHSLRAIRSAESSRRNFRMRANPSHCQDSTSNMFSRGSSNGDLNEPPVPSMRVLPVNHPPDLNLVHTGDDLSSQNQPYVVRVPPLTRNMHSFRWNGPSSSRTANSSSSPIESGVRDVPRVQSNPRRMSRNMPEHPMFIPVTELRHSAQNPTSWNLASGNSSAPGNVASTSRTPSSSGVHSSSAPNQAPNRSSSSQYPRRLSEIVRRSLLSSTGSESGGQMNNYPPLLSGPSASSQDMVPSSGGGYQASHHSYSRSAQWLEIQGDGTLGFPHPMRNFSNSSNGRSRLVSEIRNVLDLYRRGEGLRFEDQFMILDHPLIFAAADGHDRHRDMRLDVDNMSYEELLALEERIGNVNTGLSEETILNCLIQRQYSCMSLGAEQDMEPCCVCQEEYIEGEDLGKLDCGHEFHTTCIKQWLMQKNLCPVCKTSALKNH